MPIHVSDAIILPSFCVTGFDIFIQDMCDFVLYVHIYILNN
jgi:hypothetical protein